MQLFTLDSSKVEVLETQFFDIVITQHDHLTYAKHVLDRLFVSFTIFWYLCGGGVGPPKVGTKPSYVCSFSLWTAQQFEFFQKLSFPYHDHLTFTIPGTLSMF